MIRSLENDAGISAPENFNDDVHRIAWEGAQQNAAYLPPLIMILAVAMLPPLSIDTAFDISQTSMQTRPAP